MNSFATRPLEIELGECIRVTACPFVLSVVFTKSGSNCSDSSADPLIFRMAKSREPPNRSGEKGREQTHSVGIHRVYSRSVG